MWNGWQQNGGSISERQDMYLPQAGQQPYRVPTYGERQAYHSSLAPTYMDQPPYYERQMLPAAPQVHYGRPPPPPPPPPFSGQPLQPGIGYIPTYPQQALSAHVIDDHSRMPSNLSANALANRQPMPGLYASTDPHNVKVISGTFSGLFMPLAEHLVPGSTNVPAFGAVAAVNVPLALSQGQRSLPAPPEARLQPAGGQGHVDVQRPPEGVTSTGCQEPISAAGDGPSQEMQGNAENGAASYEPEREKLERDIAFSLRNQTSRTSSESRQRDCRSSTAFSQSSSDRIGFIAMFQNIIRHNPSIKRRFIQRCQEILPTYVKNGLGEMYETLERMKRNDDVFEKSTAALFNALSVGGPIANSVLTKLFLELPELSNALEISKTPVLARRHPNGNIPHDQHPHSSLQVRNDKEGVTFAWSSPHRNVDTDPEGNRLRNGTDAATSSTADDVKRVVEPNLDGDAAAVEYLGSFGHEQAFRSANKSSAPTLGKWNVCRTREDGRSLSRKFSRCSISPVRQSGTDRDSDENSEGEGGENESLASSSSRSCCPSETGSWRLTYSCSNERSLDRCFPSLPRASDGKLMNSPGASIPRNTTSSSAGTGKRCQRSSGDWTSTERTSENTHTDSNSYGIPHGHVSRKRKIEASSQMNREMTSKRNNGHLYALQASNPDTHDKSMRRALGRKSQTHCRSKSILPKKYDLIAIKVDEVWHHVYDQLMRALTIDGLACQDLTCPSRKILLNPGKAGRLTTQLRMQGFAEDSHDNKVMVRVVKVRDANEYYEHILSRREEDDDSKAAVSEAGRQRDQGDSDCQAEDKTATASLDGCCEAVSGPRQCQSPCNDLRSDCRSVNRTTHSPPVASPRTNDYLRKAKHRKSNRQNLTKEEGIGVRKEELKLDLGSLSK